MTARNRATIIGALLTVLAVVAGCGAIPDNSSPQPIRAFHRENPPNAVPVPQADMDSEALVRAFVKATANPRGNYRAARKFLTRTASAQWDSSGDMVVVDEVNVFIDERSATTVRLRLVGDNVGTLRPDGQLLPATGRVAATFDLRLVNDQWRIDGRLPSGTLIDKNQFESLYRSATLYFPNNERTALVPDPRWLYAGTDTDPGTLIRRLIAGPAADLRAAAGTAFPRTAALRGKVGAVADGGVQVPLTGIGEQSDADQQLMVAQIVWTLEGLEIAGPYQITDDGHPIREDHADGWQSTDVAGLDPNGTVTADAGLSVIRDGALLRVGATTTPVAGELGTGDDLRSASISPDGKRVAGVLARRPGAASSELVAAPYGGAPTTLVVADSIARPSFGHDAGTIWSVVDGRVQRWERGEDGADHMSAVDITAVNNVVRGAVTELQVAPDGVRVAMVVDGQLVFAVVSTNIEGRVMLSGPRIAAYNVGSRVTAIDWASPTTLVLARDAPESPVLQLSINGTQAVGLLSGNLSPPVRSVAADLSTVYVGDSRGVLSLGSTNGEPDQYWTEVESAMTPGATPVLP
ncbi:hypothetical protein GII33_16835 [Gordonia pseudamarae]|uniref:Lipoprotein LpqB n=1 Tax=Gordonia pseudamarae TaxID=2831662 RepID=A0ABX6ILL5_9ACTN|nr:MULTISPECIES: LpqB family beta-propeller domain-containing protein [Gordonia]MBD0022763.1 GerMN domain-containing protein [Gordonia sp. (in: high G+C Gram-positive bacteria)]QHN27362.1 hypothetical protein GII33_16835 [Gordonia pseudamarae]QHN36246.1 hypothetical protein GII31_16610 [Gordonia pseudamarae]